MSANSSESTELHKVLTSFPHIVSNWESGDWSWDGRFSCPTAVVEDEDRERALGILRKELHTVYNHMNHQNLPGPLARIIEFTGGLRPGQCILIDQGKGDVYRYALWWPWTNGVTVSIRLGQAK